MSDETEVVQLDTDDGYEYFRVLSGGKEVTISRALYDHWARVESLYMDMQSEMRHVLHNAGHAVMRTDRDGNRR